MESSPYILSFPILRRLNPLSPLAIAIIELLYGLDHE